MIGRCVKSLGQSLVLALAATLPATGPAATDAGFGAMNSQRIWDMARVGRPVVSPDGRWVVFTVTAFRRGSSHAVRDLWLVATEGDDGPRQLTRNPGPDFDPAWSPDSRSIVYASVRDAEPSQLYLLSLRGGEPTPVTRFPSNATKPQFTRGGEAIIFQAPTFADINDNLDVLTIRMSRLQAQERFARGSESRFVRRSDGSAPGGSVTHLFRLDLKTGVVRDLMPGFARSTGVVPFEWSLAPSGKALAFTANSSPPPYVSLNPDVFLLSLEAGDIANLTADNPGADFGPVFTPTSDAVVYGRKRRPDSLAEFTQLMRFSLRNARHEPITDQDALSPEHWQVARNGRSVYFHAQHRGHRFIYRVPIGGGKSRAMIDAHSAGYLDLGPRDQIFYRAEGFFDPPSIYVSDRNGRHRRQLTTFNRALTENARVGTVRDFEYKGANGDPVHGFLLFPPGFDPAARWPVLMMLHGGPHSAWLDSFHWRWNLGAFTIPGYVVAAVNIHGSTGYGQEFAQEINGDPVTVPATDVLAAVDTLTRQPFVDETRIALIGGSYGGYLANWIVTQTHRFSTAVVHAGIFDLLAQYATDFPWGRELTWGGIPWQEPERLARWSPSYRSRQIQTPILLLHGENDTRVPVAHSLQLHNILTGRGVPSRIVLFPNEGHAIQQPESAEIWWQEIFAWLERFAPPGPR